MTLGATSTVTHRRGLSGRQLGIIAGCMILLCGVLLATTRRSGGSSGVGQTQAYYTVDDGRTWFADDISRIPPFDKDGKSAVRAYVYQTASGKPFVNHLERYKPAARQALMEIANASASSKTRPNTGAVQTANTEGREVKRPGETLWICPTQRDAGKVVAIKSPDGSIATPFEP